MNDCVFCAMVKSEPAEQEVYRDAGALAFVDRHPINPGHLLVIPRRHEANLFGLNDAEYVHLMLTVRRLAAAVEAFSKPVKVGLVVAGWDVPHAHVHIVPMHDYHDITSRSMLEGRRATPSNEDLAEVARALTDLLG